VSSGTNDSPEVNVSNILIVGAGIAGSLAAHQLRRAGHDVELVDKGHVPGGRVATRTVDGAVFDYGAQFLTAKTARFAAVVDDWCAGGTSRPWFHGSPDLGAAEEPEGFARFRGVPTMRRIGEHLAMGLNVRLGTVVDRLEVTPTGWRLTGSLRDGGRPVVLEADALLLTAPIPQSLALLDTGSGTLAPAHRAELEAINYDPTIAVLAVPHGDPTLPERGAVRLEDPDVVWLTDNRATGASPVPAVTIHGSAAYSRTHFDAPTAEVGRNLVARARPHLGTDADVVYVHRWRYAAPTSRAKSDSILDASNPGLLAIAGDGLTGGRVEGAAISGLDAADRLTAALRHPTGHGGLSARRAAPRT